MQYTYSDIFLVPERSEIVSRDDPSTSVVLGKFGCRVPIVSANMDTVTEATMAIVLWHEGALGALHRFCSVAENVKQYLLVREAEADCCVSVGVREGEIERARALVRVGATHLIVDVAHGHSVQVRHMLGQLRDEFGDGVRIIAGNVATASAVKDLKAWGADIVKVGIGGGSICSTRVTTGFGVPMFSCLLECCAAADEVGVQVIADGGIKCAGDVAKAFVAGADAVMLGSLLAGTDETPGSDDDLRKEYRGMASRVVQEQIGNGTRVAAEGVRTYVDRKGPVQNVVRELAAALRSSMSYGNCRVLSEMVKIRWGVQTNAGFVEGTPHILGGNNGR